MQLADASNPDWNRLAGELWERIEHSGHGWRSTHYYHHRPEEVRLSQVGWDQIKQLVVDRKIPVSVVNSCFGFSCSIVLWKPLEEPFPGAVIEAVPIIQICSHMLPGDDKCHFKEGWTEFSPLFTSPENVELLKQSRLELPREASYYDY